jgi:hypothetical protein
VRKLSVAIAIALVLLALISPISASAGQFTLMVDVSSLGTTMMGSGALSMGGGPMTFNGQPVGTFMHTSQSMTMPGMMGQMESFQQRMITFQLPGIGTVFAMMAGGNPWTGATGIIMGGTDAARGVSGTVTVGDQASPNHYPFVMTIAP